MSETITVNTKDLITQRFDADAPPKINTYNLVGEDNHILGEKCNDYSFITTPTNDANEFASSLVETCKLHKGFGLSAYQSNMKIPIRRSVIIDLAHYMKSVDTYLNPINYRIRAGRFISSQVP